MYLVPLMLQVHACEHFNQATTYTVLRRWRMNLNILQCTNQASWSQQPRTLNLSLAL